MSIIFPRLGALNVPVSILHSDLACVTLIEIVEL